jgi:DNA-binding MarR family transcriptional regulator
MAGHRRHADAAEQLALVAPLAARWIERLLAAHEPPLSVAQYLALRAIAAGDASAAELARRAAVSGAAVSQLVRGLEDAGYVEREAGAADRRRHELRLTSAGEVVVGSASAALRSGLADVLSPLPPPEADTLVRLLEQVGSALGGTPPPRRRPPPPPRPPKR